MLKNAFRAIFLALLGMGLGCAIVQFAVSRWSEVSSYWIISGMVWPLIGLMIGQSLAEPTIGARRVRLRVMLAPDYPSVASSLGEWVNWAVCEGEHKIGIRPIEAINGHLTRSYVTEDATDG